MPLENFGSILNFAEELKALTEVSRTLKTLAKNRKAHGAKLVALR
jgi:hypothetical protein